MMGSRNFIILHTIIVIFIVNTCTYTGVEAMAPRLAGDNGVSAAARIYEGGSDYLPLEEDDEEFPEESIAFLRSMAQSFRSGFGSTLAQGGSPADAIPGGGGGEEEDKGSGAGNEAESQGGPIMKYILQIMKGFQAMRKSITEMFQQIATMGGQRLANRVANRMSQWARQGPSQAQGAVSGAGGAASAAKPFRK